MVSLLIQLVHDGSIIHVRSAALLLRIFGIYCSYDKALLAERSLLPIMLCRNFESYDKALWAERNLSSY